jgi:hypothetical protein
MTVAEKVRQAGEELGESLVSVKLAFMMSLIIACLSGGFGAAAGAYAFREDIGRMVNVAVDAEAKRRDQALTQYVPMTMWLEWRRSEGERRDRQYYDLRELILRRR